MSVDAPADPAQLSSIAYASSVVDRAPAEALRGLLIAGVVHGVACLVYLTQRLARWTMGTEEKLDRFQPFVIASAGLLMQSLASIVLAAACLAMLCKPTDGRRRLVFLAAAALGSTWFAYGLLDDLWIFGADRDAVSIAADAIRGLARELNQALLPTLLVFSFRSTRTVNQVSRATRSALVASCLLQAVISLGLAISIRPYFADARLLRRLWPDLAAGPLFVAAAVALIAIRRPFALVAAIPLAILVVQDTAMRGVARLTLLRSSLTLGVVWQQLREISLTTIIAGAAIAGCLAFTAQRLPRPTRRR